VGTKKLNPNNEEQMTKHVDELVRRLTLEGDAEEEPEWEQVNQESPNNEETWEMESLTSKEKVELKELT
jgi:hypothetical protein